MKSVGCIEDCREELALTEQQALIHSNMAGVGNNEHLKAIKLSTYGVIFFGTPHQGTDSASWGKVLVNVATLYQHTNKAILNHLERDSEWLETQLEQYKAISSDIFTIFCYESCPTALPAGRSIVVGDSNRTIVAPTTDMHAAGLKSVCSRSWNARRGIC